ncbi:MAG TPA: ABC transporter permease [Burkholderiaceae bacterium]|nr:ABC transporter permease [Burkholderiaceae bacterium]
MKLGLVFVPRVQPSRALTWLSPVAAAVLTLLAGALLFVLMGQDPVQGLRVFLVEPLATLRGWSELALKATPLMLCAVGLTLCFRANVWNIGAEGQLIAGAIVGGAAWAAITAWLRDRFNANEILVSLMLVYVAQLLLAWLVHGALRDPQGFGFPQSKLFEGAARMPIVLEGTRLNMGFPLALAVTAATWWLLARSLIGFQLKVAGLAPLAATYAGFSSRRVLWFVLLACGALAGVAGALEAAGPIGQLTPTISPGYGFAAIIVAFVGRLHPFGVVAGSLLMALFYIGGELAQSRLGLPSALTGVYQGLLLFFLLMCDTFIVYRPQWRRTAKALAAT